MREDLESVALKNKTNNKLVELDIVSKRLNVTGSKKKKRKLLTTHVGELNLICIILAFLRVLQLSEKQAKTQSV